jgi:hypothetical protein
MLLERARSFVTKVIAKDRAAAAGRDINAPVFTGDIKDSDINIDQKSFSQAQFLSQASAFDNCNNKIPLLWAALQCLKLLSPSSDLMEKLKLKFIKDKASFSVVVLNEEAKNIRLLYFKNTSDEINRKDLKAIVSNVYKETNQIFS